MTGKEARTLKREAAQLKVDAQAMLENVGNLWDKAEHKHDVPNTSRADGKRIGENTDKCKTIKTKNLRKYESDKSDVRLAPAPGISDDAKKADHIYNRALAVMDEAQRMMWESNLMAGKEARLVREEAKQLKQAAEETVKHMGLFCLASEEQRRCKIQKHED